MTDSLVIFAGDGADASGEWVMVTGQAVRARGQFDRLDEIDAPLPGRGGDVVLVLRGEMVAARSLTVPVKARSQLLKAARFFLEDELAQPTENLHLAVAPATQNAPAVAVAVAQEHIAGMVPSLSAAGLSPTRLVVDFQLLPGEDSGSALITLDRVLVNRAGTGFAVETALADDVLVDFAGDAPLSVFDGTGGDRRLQDLQNVTAVTDPVAWLAMRAGNDGAVNLLQGDLAPRQDYGRLIRPLRRAGILAAACLVLTIGAVSIDAWRLGQGARALEAQTEKLFAERFPDLPRTDIRRQLRGMIGPAGNGTSVFLPLLDQLSAVLEQEEEVRLVQISYTAEGELVADVQFADFALLDQLKSALAGAGISVREGRNQSGTAQGFYTAKLFLEVGA